MDILAYIDRIEDLYGNVLPRRKPPRPIADQYQDYKQVQEYFEPRTQMYIEKEMGFDEGGLATPKRGLVDEPGSYSGKPLISDSELKRLAKKFTQKEISQRTGVSLPTVQRYFTRLGLKSAHKPGGYKGGLSQARKELEKKLPKIRKLYLKDKLTIQEIANELGYTKKQVESVIEALRGQRGSITEPERKKLYEKNKITKEDFAKRGKINLLKTPQNVVDKVIEDSKNFSFSETAKRNNLSLSTINEIRKDYNLKFPYRESDIKRISDRVTKDANKLLNVLKKEPTLIKNIEKAYEKAGLDKVKGMSAIQALKTNTVVSGNVPRFDLSKGEQKLVDELTPPRMSVETEARKAGVKEADIKSGMLKPRVALQEYFSVGDVKKRGTVFEHAFPRSLIPFIKNKKLQQQLMITGERTSPFLNDFKIRFDRLQKNAVEKFLQDGNLTEYNKTINKIRDTVRKATGGYEIGYIKFDKNKNATPIVKAKPITEGVKQFGIETTQKVSGFKNAKYTTNLLKNYVKNPNDPIFNTLREEVPVEKITPKVIEASENAAKAYKKAEPFIGNRQKFINFAKNNLDNSLVNALFKSPYGRAAIITGAVLSSSSLAASELEAVQPVDKVQPKPMKMDSDVNFLSDYKPGAKDYATAGYGAALASKYTKADPLKKIRRAITAAPVRKGIGHLLRPFGTVSGAIAAWPLAAYASNKFAEPGEPPVKAFDYKNPMDRIGAAGELALSKQLVGGSQQLARKFKDPLVRRGIQRAANLGLSPKWAIRAARVGSPIGWVTLGLEGVYQYGKWAKGEIERIKNMTPEERAQYNAEQQEQMGMAAANGGLASLTRTTPPKRGPQYRGLDYLKYYGR